MSAHMGPWYGVWLFPLPLRQPCGVGRAVRGARGAGGPFPVFGGALGSCWLKLSAPSPCGAG